jgi:hypothetical protein
VRFEFIPTDEFARELKKLAKKYKSLKGEFEELQNQLEKGQTLRVNLGNNAYKIRLDVKSKGKGKSGGLRVITYVDVILIEDLTNIYFLSIYDKSDISNISDNELIKRIEKLGN